MSKEWPDVPALLAEADRADEDVFNVAQRERDLIRRLADALETMHDLYLQADTAAVNLIAEKDELQARIRAAKEQAWDEGHEAAWSHWVPGGIEPAVNPYTKEEP